MPLGDSNHSKLLDATRYETIIEKLLYLTMIIPNAMFVVE